MFHDRFEMITIVEISTEIKHKKYINHKFEGKNIFIMAIQFLHSNFVII